MHSIKTHRDSNSYQLPTNDFQGLEEPLNDKEITCALYRFKPYKSPGPDGLHPFFYQKFWGDAAEKVNHFCHQIFNTKVIPHDLNRTYICLIPRVKHATTIQQYRPIM